MLSESQNHRCAYCCTKTYLYGEIHNDMPKIQRATIDHIIPISEPVQTNKDENLVMACMQCNSIRGTIDAIEFYNYIRAPRNVRVKQEEEENEETQLTDKDIDKKQRALTYALIATIFWPEESQKIINISNKLKQKSRADRGSKRNNQIKKITKRINSLAA